MPGAWGARLSESACARIAQAVVSQEGLEARPAVLVHDLSMMEGKFDALAEAFPEPALHAVAVKANPVVEILRRLVARGAGLECASIEEVEVALRAGAAPSPGAPCESAPGRVRRPRRQPRRAAPSPRTQRRAARPASSRASLRVAPARP